MKQYTFEITVTEGNDEFWEELEKENSTGCEAVTDIIKSCLDANNSGLVNVDIKLKKFLSLDSKNYHEVDFNRKVTKKSKKVENPDSGIKWYERDSIGR